MTLPKIEHPISLIYIHSLDREVKFRPFLVKEEKILLIVKESKNPEEIRLAIKQIIQNCVCEPLNIDALPLFDIEMIFVKIRARSVGETVKLKYNCQVDVDGQPCNTDTDYVLDLSKVKYEMSEGHNNTIMITGDMGIKLKYVTLEEVGTINEEDLKEPFAEFLIMVMNNIECVFNKETVWKPEDLPKEELEDFVNNLTVEHIEHIKDFFRTAPRVVLEDSMKCKKCGYEHTIHSEGLISFFI